jgi:hypothetical protein
MSTKYELMAELRALNRGMKALPISKMKKHELEHSIDAMKKLKLEKAETPMGPPAKAGRPLSRPIASESIEDDDVVLVVPKAPRERLVEKRSDGGPKRKVIVTKEHNGQEHLCTAPLFPAVVAARSAEQRKRQFGTASKPIVAVHPEDSDEEMAKKVKKLQKAAHSGKDHSGKDHSGKDHSCNCEGCPKKTVAFE